MIKSFLWCLAERGRAQVVSFLVVLILSRLLEPHVFGTVALISVFTSILRVFVNSGFGSTLIQNAVFPENGAT